MDKIIHHIRKVRRQPEEVRQSILHILTITSGVILFLLWVVSIGSGGNEVAEQSLEENIAPFSALKANLVDGYKSISNPATPEIQYDPQLEFDTTY